MFNSIKSVLIVAAVAFGILSALGTAVSAGPSHGYQSFRVTIESSYAAEKANVLVEALAADINQSLNQGHTIHFDPVHIDQVAPTSLDFHVYGNLPSYTKSAFGQRSQLANYDYGYYIIKVRADNNGNNYIEGWSRN